MISQQPGTHSIDLVEDLPLLVEHPQGLGCLDCSLQLARPHLQLHDLLLLDELLQRLGELGRKAPGRLGG